MKANSNCTVECNPLLGRSFFDAVEAVMAGKPLPKRIAIEEGVFPQEVAREVLQSNAGQNQRVDEAKPYGTEKLRQTEMRALQEQIKPHFIYNTLEVIIDLLETNKNEDVINMVEDLGAFFRVSLSHGQELRQEVEHIRNYLYIQKIRHGDKYDYRIEVEEEIQQGKTIKLVLQPLVENAIYHGVRDLENSEGLITVKGYAVDEIICFEVIDNGKGIPAELVEEINGYLEGGNFPEQEKHGFGLRNVNERIVLAFGKEYGLRITSEPGKGTKAFLRLPLLQ